LPAFVGHGEHDPLLGPGAGREVRDELQNAGLQVTYREYPMGHMIMGEEVADLRSWLTLTR
jgi:phospholipase/carboxylesterase